MTLIAASTWSDVRWLRGACKARGGRGMNRAEHGEEPGNEGIWWVG